MGFEINKIYNEDCLMTIDKMITCGQLVDLVITSPPYNMTNRKGGYADKCKRYDVYEDWMNIDDYINFITNIFKKIDNILSKNGVFILNIGYSIENPSMPYILINNIIENTSFTVADTIIWKKKNGVPFPANERRLSRIWEYVVVLVRKKEINTYNTYKGVKKVSIKTGQKYYNLFYNYIEAKNNDGSNDLNKATFSTDLISKILDIYAKRDVLVYDPFMGTGTTAVACRLNGINFIGSEISNEQCLFGHKRLENIK